MIAFDPAGGCTVRVSIMKPTPNPVARPTAHHVGPNNERHPSAINAEAKCPTITERGCDNGASGRANNNKADAPNEPSNMSPRVFIATYDNADTAITAPRVARKMWEARNDGGMAIA